MHRIKSGNSAHRRRYDLAQCKTRVEFDILNDIRDLVTLVQLIGTADNVHHDVSINGCWIYDPNYKISLPLLKESLDIIWFTSKYDKSMYS